MLFLIKLLFKLTLFLIPLLLIITPAILVLSAIQEQPLVQESSSMDHADVGSIKDFLKQHDPRKLADGESKRLSVSERDLNLMLNYSLPYASRQESAIALSWDEVEVFHTVELPANPLGKFANISAHVQQKEQRLEVASFSFGDTSVPGWLLNPVILAANNYLAGRYPEYRDLMDALQDIELRDDTFQLTYQWQSDLADKIQARGRDLLLPAADRERILAYYSEISRVSHSSIMSGSLTELLQPLFALARQRSEQVGAAQAENRALFLALGVAIRGSSVANLVGSNNGELPPRHAPMRLTLHRRGDLAKHFALSAAITAAGGSGLADAVGVFKELDDSRGGTGFSFADLLADRAGVELTNAALGNKAAQVQRRMSQVQQESDYMPAISALPEGLMELEFKSSYESLDSASYALVEDEINRRIATCSVYR